MGAVKAVIQGGACYFQSSVLASAGHSGAWRRGILSILGLAQGERRAISNVKDKVIGKSSLVTPPMHAKETVKLLHLRRQPKEDNMLADY